MKTGLPAQEPDQELYGVKVQWQSEHDRIEAAEFLLATRQAEDARRRLARAVRRARLHRRELVESAIRARRAI